MYRTRKRKAPKVIEQTLNFRFFNGGQQYVCSVTAPIDIPKYRIKEVFDRTFVGKKATELSVLSSYTVFKALHRDISYTVQTIKEYEECQTQK